MRFFIVSIIKQFPINFVKSTPTTSPPRSHPHSHMHQTDWINGKYHNTDFFGKMKKKENSKSKKKK